MNYLNIDTLKYEPLSVKVGDRINMNGHEYMISEITYNGGVDTIGTVRFECEALSHWPPRLDEEYTPYLNHITFESLWPKPYYQQQEEEISDEIREEFMRLLK